MADVVKPATTPAPAKEAKEVSDVRTLTPEASENKGKGDKTRYVIKHTIVGRGEAHVQGAIVTHDDLAAAQGVETIDIARLLKVGAIEEVDDRPAKK